MAPSEASSLSARAGGQPGVFCFDFNSSDGLPLELQNDSEVVVIAVVGKTTVDCSWTKGLPLEELLSRKPRIPESWLRRDASPLSSSSVDIRGIYDRKEQLVILTLKSPVTDEEALGKLGDEFKKRFVEDGFLPTWPTINAEFHQAVLWLASVSHLFVVSNDGDAFDASWVRILLAVNNVRERCRKEITQYLETFDDCINDYWIDNGRLCSPRMLFYVHSNSLPTSPPQNASPHHEKRQFARHAEILEDRIYKIFRKARVVTNNTAYSVIALPSKERYVFVASKKAEKKEEVSSCQRRGDLGNACGWGLFGDLVRNCESPSEPRGFERKRVEKTRFEDDEEEDDELEREREKQRRRNYQSHQQKSLVPTYSFRNFIFAHVNKGFSGGFDDSVGRHGSFFVLPRFRTWLKVAKGLHGFFLGEKTDEKVLDLILRAVDTEMQFSEAKCEKVFPLALAAYQEGLPPHYNEVVHKSRLSMAENLMIGQRTGPLCSKYLEDLRAECEGIWKSGRQMCSEISLRGNPCINSVHVTTRDQKHDRLPVMPHNTGLRFTSTCNCGRKQGMRDDPFSAREANIKFYAKLAEACCKRRCNLHKLPKRRRRLSAGGDLTDVKSTVNNQDVVKKVEVRPGGDREENQAREGAGNVTEQAATRLSLDFQRASLSQQSNESITAQEIIAARERVARGLKTRTNQLHSSSDSPKFPLTPSESVVAEKKSTKVTRKVGTQSSDASSEGLAEQEEEDEDGEDLDDEDDERTEELFRRLRLEDEEGEEEGGRRGESEDEEVSKSKSLPESTAPSPALGFDDESHWALVCVGPSSIYSHSHGIQDQPSFSTSSNFLVPWNVKVLVQDKEKWMRAAEALVKHQPGQWAGKKAQNRQDQIENNEARVKIFVGIEYECPKGHRFMAAAPNKILRAAKDAEKGNHVKDSGKDVLEQDMPLYMNCSCRSEPTAVAQLMRIHVVTPKSPARVVLNPRVRPGPDSPEVPVFDFHGSSFFSASGGPVLAGCCEPVVLAPSKYWVLRLPYSYVDEERQRCFYPPKDGTNPGLKFGVLLRGSLGVCEPGGDFL